MNPHFIFNSLNSINYFISRNDRLNANQFISDFSRLIRAIMNNSSQEYISLDSEIEAIREYLSLEHLRFSDKFDYEIKVDDAIDTGSTEVTPSMVQPFIENAIWHGMRYLDHRKGFLSVRFVLENGSLVSYVEDDGIGRKLSAQRKSDEQRRRRSRGIALVEERLKIINALLGEQYALLIRDLYGDQKESGTAVRLEIPFKRT
jgi:LytS/YehU family sensor histidine kinase